MDEMEVSAEMDGSSAHKRKTILDSEAAPSQFLSCSQRCHSVLPLSYWFSFQASNS